jgi:hypothetical protein
VNGFKVNAVAMFERFPEISPFLP